ncbi:magnesium transporter MgtE N-terminal domain-containing protein [Luteococcus sp. OSA5]|uniref:magnesium transporter MgtE N-terminal domain-containing protein n=1 Tax=Luteococcus sp. OSA5 TaxID=3401630 RepID=UPI003B436FE2
MSVSSSSVFISRLRGLPVLDASGDQVGRVRDVVIQLRTQGRAPRVKGLVVELFGRRRIFVPMPQVHAVAATQVAIEGQVDTRRFSQRDAETLVIDELFDRTVNRPDAKRAAIYDVAMRPTRAKEWEVTDVALREITAGGRFGLSKRGATVIVDWSEIPNLVLNASQVTDNLLAQMVDMKPADMARELHDMAPERRAEIVEQLDDEQLADALEELPEDEQVELLTTLDHERAADVLEEMNPDDAADLIKELPAEMAEDLLQRMEPEDAADVRGLMIYADLTAGGMMTPEPVILAPDATVAEALARVRDVELTPALASMVFICRPPLDTPSGRFLGLVHTQRLLREPPSLMVSGMVDDDLEPLRPHSDLAAVSRYFATYNLVAAPVVNDDNQLVGAVAVDDLLDHMLPEDWRGDQMDGDDEEVSHG